MSAALATAGAVVLSATLTSAASAAATGPAPALAPAEATASQHSAKPTIVLTHGAFEDGSVWDGVVAGLQRRGFTVLVPAVALRGVASDAAYVASIVRSVTGPVVLAGHSYGGMVISEVAAQAPNVVALVYAAAFIPRAGESIGSIGAGFAAPLLGPATTHAINSPTGIDLYVNADSYRAIFDPGRSAAATAVVAATQRPVTVAALGEPAAATAPAAVPEFALIATQDQAINPDEERFMAARAGARTVEVRSPHNLPGAHPEVVIRTIERAAGVA